MKKEDRTAVEKLLSILPEDPPAHVLNDTQIMEDLGKNVIAFKRDSVEVEPGIGDFLLPTANINIKHKWGSRCKCFSCSEEFIGGYKDGELLLYIGDDGSTYDGFIDPKEVGMDMIQNFKPDETVECPCCGETCDLVSMADLKNGRTFRTQTASLENIMGNTVIVYWLAERRISRTGYSRVNIYPRMAVAVLPSGKLARYTHTKTFMSTETVKEKWTLCEEIKEPELISFALGGFRSMSGCWFVDYLPEMEGSTGEKTGIDAYWGHYCPTWYLQLWKHHHAVENLVKTGASPLVESFLTREKVSDFKLFFDKSQSKPHRILNLSKQDYSVAVNNEWNVKMLEGYRDYKKVRPTETAADWQEYVDEIELSECVYLRSYWKVGLRKLIRYFRKQQDNYGATIYMFTDYRRMLKDQHEFAGIEEYTEEELWPRNVRDAHDRLMVNAEVIAAWKRKESQKNYMSKFIKMKQDMKPLEWTNGEYVIVIPEGPDDLIREGETLHHCVGSYSPQHLNGRPIFFVRHYRRPERSWYTLNEDLTQDTPRRVQLHGFHNEVYKDKHLRIPDRVLEFVDTWERDILAPWMKNRKGVTA